MLQFLKKTINCSEAQKQNLNPILFRHLFYSCAFASQLLVGIPIGIYSAVLT